MKPNVLLIILDSVRARNTSLHGYHRNTTPFLQKLAERATVYEQARSPSIWSLPSHTSIFTGLVNAEHQVNTIDDHLPEGHTIWEELSKDHGYVTGVFSENPFLTRISGLKNVFDSVPSGQSLPFPEALHPGEVLLDNNEQIPRKFLSKARENRHPVKSLLNGMAWGLLKFTDLVPKQLRPDRSSRVYVDKFLEWEEQRDGPWAACINLMDAHAPYEPRPRFQKWSGMELQELRNSTNDGVWEFTSGQQPWWKRRAIMGLYDGCIRQMDNQVERLLSNLDRRGELDDTLLVITSDHGEAFGEQSNVRPAVRQSMHGYGIHEVLLHVPLIVRVPGQQDGRSVSQLASLTRFPNVVRKSIENTGPITEGFVAENPLLVSSYERGSFLKKAEQYHDDISRFTGDAHALYEPGDEFITKHMCWGEDVATVRIRKQKRVEEISEDREHPVKNELAKYEEVGIGTQKTGQIDSSTKDKLKDLGYI